MKKTEKEILKTMCGVDQYDNPKAMVKIQTHFLDLDEGKDITDEEIIVDSAIVNIFRSANFAMLDLQFASGTDPDFVSAAQILRNFCRVENSLEGNLAPTITVTLMAKEEIDKDTGEGMYFATGLNGIWNIQTSQFNRPADTVRFIFENNDFHCYQVKDDAFDSEEVNEDGV